MTLRQTCKHGNSKKRGAESCETATGWFHRVGMLRPSRARRILDACATLKRKLVRGRADLCPCCAVAMLLGAVLLLTLFSGKQNYFLRGDRCGSPPEFAGAGFQMWLAGARAG